MNTTGALQFLVSQLFDIYCYIVFARFFMQLVKADFYNPIAQFVVKATNPVIMPLRKVIPGFLGVDMASLLLLFVLQVIKVLIIYKLLHGMPIGPIGVLFGGLMHTVSLCIGFFIFLIFIQIILSWVAPHQHNPMTLVLDQLCEPLLAPARRILPPLGGFDLSPMLVIFALYFIKILLGV